MVFTLSDLIPFSLITLLERATGASNKIQSLDFQVQLGNDTKIPNGIKRKLKFLGKIKGLIAKLFDSKTLLRKQIAARYLTGNGIEIGALNSPLKVPASVKIRYLDRMNVSQLRQQYAELSKFKLVEPDIIDDGEVLASVADDSLNFVIANHLIEHCQNPIFSLENWLRVLKHDGVLYIAVPDKRYTFDCERSLTPLEHLIRDYNEGPLWSRNLHFEEWVHLVNKIPEKDVAVQAKQLAEINYSIHFHVWTPVEFLELLLYCRSKLRFPFEIELLQKNKDEFIVILSKTAPKITIMNEAA